MASIQPRDGGSGKQLVPLGAHDATCAEVTHYGAARNNAGWTKLPGVHVEIVPDVRCAINLPWRCWPLAVDARNDVAAPSVSPPSHRPSATAGAAELTPVGASALHHDSARDGEGSGRACARASADGASGAQRRDSSESASCHPPAARREGPRPIMHSTPLHLYLQSSPEATSEQAQPPQLALVAAWRGAIDAARRLCPPDDRFASAIVTLDVASEQLLAALHRSDCNSAANYGAEASGRLHALEHVPAAPDTDASIDHTGTNTSREPTPLQTQSGQLLLGVAVLDALCVAAAEAGLPLRRVHLIPGAVADELTSRYPLLACVRPYAMPDLPFCVEDGLYLSNCECARCPRAFVALGLRAVVNCTPAIPCYFAPPPPAGMHSCDHDGSGAAPHPVEYLRLNLADREDQDLLPALRRALEFIREKLDARQPVLVHCSVGVSRSVAVIIGHLMSTRGLRFDAALALLAGEYKMHGQQPAPNDGFVAQLRSFEAEALSIAALRSAVRCRDVSAAATAGLELPADRTQVDRHRDADDANGSTSRPSTVTTGTKSNEP